MVWRSKVWLLRKINRKKRQRLHNDYCSSRFFIRGFPNKPDEDWYWSVEILYTSAFFTLFDQSFALVFFTLILFLSFSADHDLVRSNVELHWSSTVFAVLFQALVYITGHFKFTFDWYKTVFCRSALWGCFGNFKIKRNNWLRFQNGSMNQLDTTTTQSPEQPQIHHNLVSRSLAEEAGIVNTSSGYEINYIKPKRSPRANVSQLFCSHFRVRQEKWRRISRKTQKVLWNI